MSNQIKVIMPYLWNGMWVFDDSSVGLVREPFVAGADTLIDAIVLSKQIPDAENGFILTFSANEFPDFDVKLVWAGGDKENTLQTGNDYAEPKTGHKAWLCPALFHYFQTAPLEIFVKAAPKNKNRKKKGQ